MRKGSISIFSLLVMMLVASVLFALLEGVRYQETKTLCNWQTLIALESAFAKYDSDLWEKYMLLGCDVNELEERITQKANIKATSSLHGLQMCGFELENVAVESYTLMTDGRGAVYTKAVSQTMQQTIGYGLAKEIFNQYEAIKCLVKESTWNSSWLSESLQLEVNENIEYNPMQEVKSMQEMGILELVIEDITMVSKATVDKDSFVSKRSLMQGRCAVVPEYEWLDKVLLQQYLLQNMKCYGQAHRNSGLEYQVEYLIGKTECDAENLKVVVSKLLLLREMTNFLYLTTNTVKMEEAGLVALALAGASGNPLVVEVVKMGIVAAWSFGESVLDIRALLQGKQIPLLKSDSTWTLDISQIGMISDGYISSRAVKDGLDYQDYLGILLLFEQEEQLSMCAMDIQELVIRSQKERAQFRMDEVVVQTDVVVEYFSNPIFLTYFRLDGMVPSVYKIKTKHSYGYY